MTLLLTGLMALLAIAAALLLTRPWWAGVGAAASRRAANVSAYRQRLGEIEAETVAGLLSGEAASALKEEAASRLLGDAAGSASSDAAAETDALAASPADAKPTRSRALPRAAILLSLLLALFAGGWYALAGSWRTQRLVAGEAPPPQPTQAEINGMADRLAQHMLEDPDNLDGWLTLGRAYFNLRRYDEATQAYTRANQLAGNGNADVLVSLGEAQAFAKEQDLQGRPRELFEQALALQPLHPKALWYAGMAAAQAQDFAATRKHWTALRSQPGLPQELAQALDEQLASLPEGAPIADGQAASAAPPSAAAASDAAVPAAAGNVSLQLEVSLAPALKAQLPRDAQIFVFAKAAQGPPMPLAVFRGSAAGLPLSVTLDDSMAMMPALKLSAFDSWQVTARISRSGGAKAESGDLEGSLAVAKSQAGQPLPLVIDHVVP